MAALSAEDATRPMDPRSPCRCSAATQRRERNWLPLSAWTTQPGTWSRPRRTMAISSASTARWLVIRESIE